MASDGQGQPSGFEDKFRQMILNGAQSPPVTSSSAHSIQPIVRLPPNGSSGPLEKVNARSNRQHHHGVPRFSHDSTQGLSRNQPKPESAPRSPPTRSFERSNQHHGYDAKQQRSQVQHQGFNKMGNSLHTSVSPQQRARNQQALPLDPNAFHRGGLGRPFVGRGRGTQQLFNPNQHRTPYVFSPADRNMRQTQYLEEAAFLEVGRVEMSEREYEEKQIFRQNLEKVCHDVCADDPKRLPKVSLEPFGSFQSGFATAGSDMDLVIVVKGSDSTSACFSLLEDDLPRALERRLLQLGYGARLLTRTRVPILKVCQQPEGSFLDKLREERWKWDDLPHEKKYPHLHLRNDGTEDGVAVEDSNAPIVAVSSSSQAIDGSNPASSPIIDTSKPKELGDDQNSVYGREQATHGSDAFKSAGLATALEPTAAAHQNEDKSDLLKPAYRSDAKPIEKLWSRERKAGPLDFPKTGVGIQSDINFFNPLGLHNTQLLRCYSLCDSRVQPMVLFVKAWAKKRKINSSYSGTLSSYGYVLMVLHYLMNITNPPVLPNLQDPQYCPTDHEEIVDGYSVRFCRDEDKIRAAAQQGHLNSNQESLGSLLNGFFHYYSSLARGLQFHWMHEVLSLRSPGGILTKVDKGWVKAVTEESAEKKVQHRYLFCIEDPFELAHNVARTVTHHGIVAIRDEFRRAYRILFAIGNGSITNEGGLFDDLVEVEDISRAAMELNKVTNMQNSTASGSQEGAVVNVTDTQSMGANRRANGANQHHTNTSTQLVSNRRGKPWIADPAYQSRALDVHDNEAFPIIAGGKQSKKRASKTREVGEEFSEISGARAQAHLEEIKRMKDEAQAESTAKGAAEAVLNGID